MSLVGLLCTFSFPLLLYVLGVLIMEINLFLLSEAFVNMLTLSSQSLLAGNVCVSLAAARRQTQCAVIASLSPCRKGTL